MTNPSASQPEPLMRRYAVLMMFNLAAMACGFGAMIVVARNFGVEGFGAIGVAQSVAAYGLWASTCGLDIYAVRQTVAAGVSASSARITRL